MRIVAVLIAAAVVAGAASAGATKKRQWPTALLTYTGSPHSDPDNGQYLACIARSDGTHRVRIVHGTLSASGPAWNPSGTLVAFTGWDLPQPLASGDAQDIVVADTRGNLLRNLTPNFSRSNFDPKWSRDGKWIAFGSDVLNLTVVPADGSQPPRVIDVPDFSGSYDWLPDGRLVLSTFDGIYSVNIDGTALTKLIAVGTDPAVSPNGRKLLFVKGDQNFDLYVANIDGTGVRRLTKTARDESSPAWSPDGKWIAYEQNVSLKLVEPHERIVVARSDGTSRRVVITGKQYDPFFPSWRKAVALPKAVRRSC